MWEKLRRFRRLDGPARGIFLRAAIALPIVSQSVRWRGFRATQGTLQKLGVPGRKRAPHDSSSAAVTARMVRAAVRHGLGHPSCLAESLTLWWLLARQGIPSEIRIGVRKQISNLEAHAWVESDGIVLNEPEGRHRHYAAFESEFPPAAPEKR